MPQTSPAAPDLCLPELPPLPRRADVPASLAEAPDGFHPGAGLSPVMLRPDDPYTPRLEQLLARIEFHLRQTTIPEPWVENAMQRLRSPIMRALASPVSTGVASEDDLAWELEHAGRMYLGIAQRWAAREEFAKTPSRLRR